MSVEWSELSEGLRNKCMHLAWGGSLAVWLFSCLSSRCKQAALYKVFCTPSWQQFVLVAWMLRKFSRAFFSSTFNYFRIYTLEDMVESILEPCLVNLMIVNSDTTFWSYRGCNVLALWPQRWASSYVTHFVSMLRSHSAILFIYLFILFSIIIIVYLKNVW